MIGGPTDLVVEPNIVRAVGAREVAREPSRVARRACGARDPPYRKWLAIAAGGRACGRHRRRVPIAQLQPKSLGLRPEPGARARPADSLTGLAAELSTRLTPPDAGTPAARHEPPPRRLHR